MILGALLGFAGAHQDVARRGRAGPSTSAARPEDADVVLFELPEVVFGLRVHQAEDRVGVGLAVDVGDAVGVAIDGDGRLCGAGGDGGEESSDGERRPGGLAYGSCRVTAPSLALETSLQYLAKTPAL